MRLLAFLFVITLVGLTACKSNTPAENDGGGTGSAETETTLSDVKFNADSAYRFVEEQCAFGPRVPNSEAHRLCGDYIVQTFKNYGLSVEEQRTEVKGWDGEKLNCRNIIASYKPGAMARIAIAAHWDCRPWADNDPDSANHRKPVMGANDGASGVAVMLEVARLLSELNPKVGIDFICFDVEDYGAPDWGTADDEGRDWCLGSQYWMQQAVAKGYTARYGVLLDMVGGKDARFCHEGFSLHYARRIVNRIWQTAEKVGAGTLFPQQDGSYATDDHIWMNAAGIPTVDIIPYVEDAQSNFGDTWHTIYDTPENISSETLRLVGQTLVQLISEEE